MYPSCVDLGEKQWLAFFDTPAGQHAMARIIGDIYAEVKAQEDKERGVRRMGRRPRPKEVPLEEVWATVFPPPYTNDPFPKALGDQMRRRGLSQRNLAMRLPFNQSTLSRLLSGELTPDLYTLERIAEALKLKPGYFAEWRAGYLGQLVTSVLLQAPHLGTTVFRDLRAERTAFDQQTA
jgi:transcriptional regulator with XRE-family HTH domain